MLDMTTDPRSGSSILARIFAVSVVFAGGSIDTGILEALARANAPDWPRDAPSAELSPNFSDGWTFLSSGYVALVEAPAKTR